eukprot:COSAG06_NODE_6279_length_3001_cov_2.951068_2_plen_327_part_00
MLFGVFFVIFLVGKHGGNEAQVHHAINSMSALFSVCFLLLVRSNAAIWDCTTPEEDGGSWTLDEFPDVSCYEGSWYGVAAYSATCLVCYVVIIPGVLLRALSTAKKDGTLVEPEIKAKFGWLFLRYKYHVCTYFEFIVMIRKAVIVCIDIFFGDRAMLVIAFTVCVLLSALVVHCLLRPYADHELDHSDEDSHDRSQWTDADKLDGIGLVCEILPVFFAIYFLDAYRGTEGGGAVEYGRMYYAVAILALIVAAVPLVLAVGVAVRAHKAQKAQQRDGASNDEEKAKGEKKTTKKVEKKMTAKKERAEAELEFENPVAGTAGDDPPP